MSPSCNIHSFLCQGHKCHTVFELQAQHYMQRAFLNPERCVNSEFNVKRQIVNMYESWWDQSRLQLDSALRFKCPMLSYTRLCVPFYKVHFRFTQESEFRFPRSNVKQLSIASSVLLCPMSSSNCHVILECVLVIFLRSRRLVPSLLTFKTISFVGN